MRRLTDQEQYQREKLKQVLMAEAERIVWERRMRKRRLKLNQINFKFLHPELNFDDKNNYVEYNLENCIMFFNQQKKTEQERRKEKEYS